MASIELFIICFVFYLTDFIIQFPFEHAVIIFMILYTYYISIFENKLEKHIIVLYIAISFIINFSYYYIVPRTIVLLLSDFLILGFLTLTLEIRNFTKVTIAIIFFIDLFLIATPKGRNFQEFSFLVYLSGSLSLPYYFILNTYYLKKFQASKEKINIEINSLSIDDQKELNRNLDNSIDNITCPISQSIMIDPVLFEGDGHTYEREFISKWIATNNTSPMTGLKVTSKTLIPNIAIKRVISDFENAEKTLKEIAVRKSFANNLMSKSVLHLKNIFIYFRCLMLSNLNNLNGLMLFKGFLMEVRFISMAVTAHPNIVGLV